MSQRVVIDSLVFAREGRSLQGELPVAGLVRVLDLLTDPAGKISYRLDGQLGSRNEAQLVLRIDGTLSLRCQRCLEGIDYPVKVCSLLELVKDEEELTREEIEDDSKDILVVQKELDVVELIEDEIILALPPAPRHESCALPEGVQNVEKVSPFSVLKGLKGKAQ